MGVVLNAATTMASIARRALKPAKVVLKLRQEWYGDTSSAASEKQ